MIICESWLREWIDVDLDAREIANCLTLAGLEVDSLEMVSPDIESVVVGRIIDVDLHPDADRLKICRVDTGTGSANVVCGAPNTRTGMLAPYARVGARLPGDVEIKRARVRGVESDGMLCSAAELGLEETSAGLLELSDEYQPGQDIVTALGLEDTVIDIDLTPNRGDCLSILGIARELRVLAGAKIKRTDVDGVEPGSDEVIGVTVKAPEACPRYLARVVDGIDPSATAPLWMRERLRRCGLRSISAVVDVSNYVMMELGQPMHAFDRHCLEGNIVVRKARKGDQITLLDGARVKPETGTLLITDSSGPVAIAGIMGGANSAVTEGTTAVVFEAAHFTRDAVAGKARSYGLQTDSSFRFERGVDPDLPFAAIHYATYLLQQIAGGVAGPIIDVSSTKAIRRPPASVLRYDRLRHVLGMEISRREVKRILGNIAGNVTEQAGGWRVVAPGYRFDIEHEADLIEEVARVKGYDAVPVRMPRVVASGRVAAEAGSSIDRVCSTLVGRGYYEAINFGFVDPRMQKLLGSGEKAIPLANPIAENLSEMRTSLWSGLVATAVSNLNRQQDRIRLFEIGRVFARKRGKIVERDVVAGVVMGPVQPGQWDIKAREVDFYDVKSDVESLLSLTGKEKNFIFISLEHKSMQSGQVARIDVNGSEVGWLGRLHPDIQRDAGSDRSVFLFELDLKLLLKGRIPRYQQISRFPAVRRDLALVLDDQVEAADVAAVLRGAAGDALVNLELFDVYRDSYGDVGPESEADSQTSSGLGVGRRSLAYRLTFQLKERTLTDAEVEGFVADALAELSTRYGAELRS